MIHLRGQDSQMGKVAQCFLATVLAASKWQNAQVKGGEWQLDDDIFFFFFGPAASQLRSSAKTFG